MPKRAKHIICADFTQFTTNSKTFKIQSGCSKVIDSYGSSTVYFLVIGIVQSINIDCEYGICTMKLGAYPV